VTGFADPHVRYGLRFRPIMATEMQEEPQPEPEAAPASAEPKDTPQVVSLDAFRRRPPSKS
jgi:hypothetical protein